MALVESSFKSKVLRHPVALWDGSLDFADPYLLYLTKVEVHLSNVKFATLLLQIRNDYILLNILSIFITLLIACIQ